MDGQGQNLQLFNDIMYCMKYTVIYFDHIPQSCNKI